jgi:hypothetical protein
VSNGNYLKLIEAKVRLEEAMNWHRFDKVHDDDSWCCKREKELRDEVMALEMARECK